MKLWWLNLYTIPAIKKYSLSLAVWAGASVLCSIFLPQIKEAAFLVAMFPWYVFINYNVNTLSNNIEFHKVHVTYPELRKAFFFDLAIQMTFFLGLFISSGYFPLMNEKSSPLMFFVGTTSMNLMNFFAAVFGISLIKIGIIKQLQAESLKKVNRSDVTLAIGSLIFLALTGYAAAQHGYSMALISFVLVLAYQLYIFIEWYMSNFHVLPSWREKLKIIGLPLYLLVSVFMVWCISFTAKKEINDTAYETMQRLQSFRMFRDFGPVLSVESLSDLIASDHLSEDLEDLFSHSENRVFEVPVYDIIKRPDFHVYLVYLKTGRVSSHNIEYLYKKVASDKGEWRNPIYFNNFRRTLSKYYPHAATLPDRKIASKKGEK